MEAIFSLSYPEYTVATYLHKYFKKNEGYSVLIPLSRQQKGFDLLLFNVNTKKATSFQIKSSRTWLGTSSKRRVGENYEYYSWFNKFDYGRGGADFYVFLITYPKNPLYRGKLDKEKNPKKWWSSRIVVFNNDEETCRYFKEPITREKPDRFFAFGFNEKPEDIYGTRGLPGKSFKENLLEFKVKEIEEKLK